MGPLNVFGKLGYVSWDVEATVSAVGVPSESVEDDGSDVAYGVGVRFGLGSIEARGEYEIFDFDETEIEMVSVSLAFYFD